MVTLFNLWLAIVLSGVFCWIASALIHMLFKYHNHDYQPLSNESEVMNVLGKGKPAPALYSIPYCKDMSQMGEDSMQTKFKEGPVAMVAIFPNGLPAMGKLLGQQMLFFIFGSALIAYLASMVFGAGTDYMIVFRFTFVAAFLTYAWAIIPFSIWMGQPWSNCARYVLDALIYAGMTAGTFAWLWPASGT